MGSWFQRLFSSSYRQAVSAEAAGDYSAAAQAYALAGLPEKVAEMHVERARRAGAGDRIAAFDDALRWVDKAEREKVPLALREALAVELTGEVAALPQGDPRRRRLAVGAARLHEEDGRFREAGEALELAGDRSEAVRCYEAAGAIEEMERLLEAESAARDEKRAGRDAFDDYEAAMARGDRLAARSALRCCVAAAPGRGYDRMLADLERRLPRPGALTFALDGKRFVFVGRMPALLGRGDADVVLRHAGISRRHAAIEGDGEGFLLRDAGSRNGTTLAGFAVSGAVRLGESGTIGLGEDCALDFEAADGELRLEIREGPDRGLTVIVSATAAVPTSESPFVLALDQGQACVDGVDGAGGLLLNGHPVSGPVVVLAGDVLETRRGGRLEVEG